MQLRLAVPRIACLIIASVLGSMILQPTTLRAQTTGLTLNSAEPPSAVAPEAAPEVYQGSFKFTRLGDMLASLGVTLDAADRVTTFPDPNLGIGSQIRIYRAPLLTIDDAGKRYSVRSWAKTVGALALERRLNLADQDATNLTPTAEITSNDVLKITRVSVATVETVQPIAFSIVQSASGELERGVQQIQQAGQNGTRQLTYRLKRENGQEVSRSLIDTRILKEPLSQIVMNGTKVSNYGSGGASWYGGVAPLTAANKELPKGTKVSVVNLANGKSVVVTIDDRGPFVGGRVIDLSPDAFSQIASLGTGVVQVRMDKVYVR